MSFVKLAGRDVSEFDTRFFGRMNEHQRKISRIFKLVNEFRDPNESGSDFKPDLMVLESAVRSHVFECE